MITSSGLRLKICGMRDADNILSVAKLRPDMMGFIFYPGSKRYVGADFKIPAGLDQSIKRVGVFVNQPMSEVVEAARKHMLNYVQLHGDETVAECEMLKRNGFRVIKAFGIDESFSFEVTRQYQPVVDLFLFDTKTPHFGGSGVRFNWGLLNGYDQQVPFLLSGGIGSEPVQQTSILKGMNVWGLDVNSGVESSPGMKDIGKIKEVLTLIGR